ncbi:hypothetical protein GQ600_2732 [Phytophthora cactorum]|nr:hypothetical protein GQ600_2732 [Phytophthora cactorum]
MPHELSFEDESNEVPGHLRKNLAQGANEIIAHGHTESQHKRKRNVAKTIKSGGKNKAAHNATKKKSTKHQQHAQISPGIEVDRTIAGASSASAHAKKVRYAGEYGVELLQKTKLNMLKFVTLVNRRWRALKDLLARKPLGGNLTLMTDIQASGMRLDFNREVDDVVEWVKANSSQSVAVEIQTTYPEYPSHIKTVLPEKFGVLS